MSMFGCPGRTLLLLILTLPAMTGELAGQVWSLDTYAGQASYKMAPGSVVSRTGVLGIRFNQDRRIFQAAVGAPFSDRDVTWGLVEAGDRFAIRRGNWVAGADASLLTHGQRDPVARISGLGVLAELLPTVSRQLGAGVLEVRSGARWYGARLGGADWTRALWTTEIRGSSNPAEGLRLESDVRHERRQNEAYTRAGFTVAAALGRAAVLGSVGGWVDGVDNTDPEWGFSLTFPVRPSAWIFATARRESFDPLFLAPPRTSWGVGMTFRIGGRPPATPTAAPDIRKNGRVVLRLPVHEAPTTAPPSVAGDFSNWTPIRMERRKNEWRYSLDLPPGVYRFAFRNADGEWFVPASVPNRTDDGMGGWVAVVVVP